MGNGLGSNLVDEETYQDSEIVDCSLAFGDRLSVMGNGLGSNPFDKETDLDPKIAESQPIIAVSRRSWCMS
ncbi:hypothetical protein MRB53_034826 [Persea americana]|uniref:Uncharacterized protein n=1 Tax=Persea americana TaxID=3435 RepID=A0ACC2K2Z4_PERAE|nr:hypothetical protein MRB53_034826 [Persea americana]